ncbi:MAG: nucleotidyltransferase substrate binding protein [Pseudomonadota bacterium]
MVDLKELDLENFEKAVKTLADAVQRGSLSDLERDGVIQRFEYTFELAWKTLRRVLLALGRANVSASPKPVLRDAVEEGLIEKVSAWFEFLEARNLSAHIYSQEEAEKVLAKAREFLPCAARLLKKLEGMK